MPDTFTLSALISELERDEAVKRFPYPDGKGNITIGVGRNLSAKGLSPSEIQTLLSNDIADTAAGLDEHLPWWRDLSDARQRVLINMAFNMGIGGLMGFHATLAAIQEGRYGDAANDMMASAWASEVGDRASRLADMMRAG